jgi:hypothetical protein
MRLVPALITDRLMNIEPDSSWGIAYFVFVTF